MPKINPAKPSRTALRVGDVVTVGNDSKPWRIAAFRGDCAAAILTDGSGDELHAEVELLFRYHGTQVPTADLVRFAGHPKK